MIRNEAFDNFIRRQVRFKQYELAGWNNDARERHGMVYVWAVLMLIGNSLAWASTAFGLPGNWLIVALAALYAYLLPAAIYPRVSWAVVGVLLGLAMLGEVLEFFAGAAGAAKHGGSRKGIMLAVAGAFVGSLAGAALLSPIPIIGPVIGALGGGAVGAFAGAYHGEAGTNRPHAERMAIGKGALIGRLMGTAGKLIIGVVMLVLITLDSFFDFSQLPE